MINGAIAVLAVFIGFQIVRSIRNQLGGTTGTGGPGDIFGFGKFFIINIFR